MLTLDLRFPAGRFHATPWGRHVNEAVPEWPPSPYRLLRALYDVWPRKLPDWPADRVEPILDKLASELPNFRLPPAGASHTRSYLSNNTHDPTDKSLVFDGFVAVDPEESVSVIWPNIDLNEIQRRDLRQMVRLLNFLGRSESWVEAEIRGPDGVSNCEPAMSSSRDGELVTLACAAARAEYQAPRHKGAPATWFDALTYSTTQMIKDRASQPPAMRYVEYIRDRRALDPPLAPGARTAPAPVTAVLYALSGKLLPRVESTIEVAEQVRTRLMGIHKRRMNGDESRVSLKFSGHDSSGSPLDGHRHCFILPLSRNERNRSRYIDHILVWCRDAFDTSELAAMYELTSLWQADGKPDVHSVLISAGKSEELRSAARHVRSVTPFVPPRHYRQGRGDFVEWAIAEVVRECANHGLSMPEITPLEGTWREFRRSRRGERPRWGIGFELVFAEPVCVPFSIGYACHFGLGQFDAPDEALR